MKKIVFICDGNNFPLGAFRLIESLHESEPLLLTGAFFHAANFDIKMAPATLSFAPDPLLVYTDTDIEAINSSILKFEKKCLQCGIEYRVHEESDVFKMEDLVKETRFADVVIISEQLFFSHIDANQPNSYMKQVLHGSECPLLVIPEDYSPVEHVAIGYDGRRESMFAMKQFCYLFPQYTHLPTDIIFWVDKTDDEIPDLEYLEEFAGRHFTNLNFKELFFDPQKYIADWLRKNRNTIFISGSYKRAGLSAFFKKSFADSMIKYPSAIIFIAHNG